MANITRGYDDTLYFKLVREWNTAGPLMPVEPFGVPIMNQPILEDRFRRDEPRR